MSSSDGRGRRALSGASLGLVQGGEQESEEGPFDVPQQDRYPEGGLLGEGGMGEVRTARDQRLCREVALKTPRADVPGAADGLFQEASLTARLAHPGIVPVYDAGRTADGRPYYTMPVVRGQSLAEAIAETPDLAERLRLVRRFLDACEAVAYAHAQGVLHRDLKPANVMLGGFGETLVVDWGLAGPPGPCGVVGTRGYMAPEQAAGAPLTPAADVHGLGAVLWELLAGGPAPAERPQLTDLVPPVPAELVAVVDRALAPAPGDRYPDASALADDVSAWVEGRHVGAYAYGVRDHLARIWAAWRVPLTVAVVAVVAVVSALATGWRDTALERDRAQAAEDQARVALGEAELQTAASLLSQALESAGRGQRAEAELLAAASLALREDPRARGVLAAFDPERRPVRTAATSLPRCDLLTLTPTGNQVACARGRTVHLRGLVDETLARDDDVVGVTLLGSGALALATTDRAIRVRQPDGTEVVTVSLWSPSMQVVAAPAGDQLLTLAYGKARQLSLSTGGEIQGPDCTRSIITLAADASPDGRILVACGDGEVAVGHFGQAGMGSRVAQVAPELGIPMIASLATDGRDQAAVGTVFGNVVVLDLETGAELLRVDLGPDAPSDIALRGGRLAVAGGRGDVQVWDIASGALVARVPSTRAQVAWRDDGQTLRVVGQAVEDWALPDSTRQRHLVTASGIAAVRFSPDARTLASAHGDGAARVWDLAPGTLRYTVREHGSVLKDLAFSPDGRWLALANAQVRGLSIADAATGKVVGQPGGRGQRRVVWLDQDTVIGAPYHLGLEVWRGNPPDQPARLEPLPQRPGDLDLDPDGRGAVVLDQDGGIWRVGGGEGVPEALLSRPGAVAVAAAGPWLVVAERQVLALFRDGEPVAQAELADARVVDVAVRPGADLLAVGHLDGRTSLWALPELRRVAELRGHETRVASVDFDPSGQVLATGSWDGSVRLWSLAGLDADPLALQATLERAWGRDATQVLALF